MRKFIFVASCLILGIVTHGCNLGSQKQDVLSGSDSGEIGALFDSAQFHLETTENIKNALPFLQKLRPFCAKSPDLLLRYNGLLMSLSWQAQNFEDVLTIAYSSLFEISVRGEVRSGQDMYQTLMAAHALKKAADTTAAIRLYEFLANTEFLAIRRGGQSNLLALQSKRGNHARAIELAKILEPTEVMNPTDISGSVNLYYYWGRSLVLSGNRQQGLQSLKAIISKLQAPRSNVNTTELRVRISTAKNILIDEFILTLPVGMRNQITRLLQKSMVSDSTVLANKFHTVEKPTKIQKATIPEHMYIVPASLPIFMKLPALDPIAITGFAMDSRRVEWISTLFGLYVRVGQHYVRVELPHHRGLPRPIRSVRIERDTIHLLSYNDVDTHYALANLIHNYTQGQSLQNVCQVTYRSKNIREANQTLLQLQLNDSTTIVGTPNGMKSVVASSTSSRVIDIPTANVVDDTVLAIYRLGDSVVTCSRVYNYRVINRQMLENETFDFTPFDPYKRFNEIRVPNPIHGIVLKQLMGEHPSSRSPIVDEWHPTTLQRILFLKRNRVAIIRTGGILAVDASLSTSQLIAWPDSVATLLRRGFFPTVLSDSVIDIATDTATVRVNINQLLRRNLAQPLVAIAGQNKRAWVGWLGTQTAHVQCSDSLTIVAGSSSILSDYLTITHVLPDWSADTIELKTVNIGRIDVPDRRSCVLTVTAAGALQPGTIHLYPETHPLMYQDVIIVLTMLFAGMGALGLVWFWHRLAKKSQELMERQHTALARDLHDTLGADLARLTTLLRTSDSKESRNIANAALAANRKFRSLLWIWRSDSIKLSEFVGELREYALLSLADANIVCSSRNYDVVSDQYIDANVAKNILLILNETITNTIRHSSASNVIFDVIREGSAVTLTITDDGTGFDARLLVRKGGISNIASRAYDSGFHAEVISAPSRGTTVLISFRVH